MVFSWDFLEGRSASPVVNRRERRSASVGCKVCRKMIHLERDTSGGVRISKANWTGSRDFVNTGVAILTESSFSTCNKETYEYFIRFSTACNTNEYRKALYRMKNYFQKEGVFVD